MAYRFGISGSSGQERGTPGYDVTSPFMSGIKENLSRIVPLALNATALKMDEDKTNALLGIRKEELARQVEDTKRKTLESQLKTLLTVASEAKDQSMMPGVASKFKELTGADYPMRTTAAPVTGPENMEDPGTRKEYFIPQTDTEKKSALQELIYNLKLGNQDAMNAFKLQFLERQLSGKDEAARLAAALKAAGVGSSGTFSYIGTDDNGQPIVVNNKTGQTKIATTPEGTPIKPKPTNKGGKPSLAEALGKGKQPEASTGFTVGEVRTVNGKNYKYLGDNKWQEQ